LVHFLNVLKTCCV